MHVRVEPVVSTERQLWVGPEPFDEVSTPGRQSMARRSHNPKGRPPDSTQRPLRAMPRVAEEKLSLRDSAPVLASSAVKKFSPNTKKLRASIAKTPGKTDFEVLGGRLRFVDQRCSRPRFFAAPYPDIVSRCEDFGLRWQAQCDTALGLPAALPKRRGAALPAAVQNTLVAAWARCTLALRTPARSRSYGW